VPTSTKTNISLLLNLVFETTTVKQPTNSSHGDDVHGKPWILS